MLVKLLVTILVPLVCTHHFPCCLCMACCWLKLLSLPLSAAPSLRLLLPLPLPPTGSKAFGKLLRQIEPLAAFRLRNKKWFGIASSTFLVTVPLMKVSTASEAIGEMAIGNLVLTIVAAIFLHLVYLACEQLSTHGHIHPQRARAHLRTQLVPHDA